MNSSWRVVPLVMMLAAGCEPAALRPPPSFAVGDRFSIDQESSPLAVSASWAPPPTMGWSVVEWPEMTVVPIVVGAPFEETADESWTMTLTPATPFGPRWYAWRWEPTTPDDEAHLVGGIPLADGSFVGRFYGAPVPEVRQLVGSATSHFDVRVWFTHQVFLDESHTLDQAVVVTQASSACSPVFLGEPGLFVDYVDSVCTPRIDWTQPVHVHVEGLESRAGIPIAPFDLERVFPAVPADQLTAIDIPSGTLPAPPVPTARCAGLACEP